MNRALIYRPNNRKLIWIAFACAITIHIAAIGLAKSRPEAGSLVVCSFDALVQGTDSPPTPAEESESILAPERPQTEQQEFVEENVKTAPIRPRRKISAVQSTNIGVGRGSSAGSAKALALFAPKPNYPYEARRGGITGSGIVQLSVNSAAGNVIDARMSHSTGNAILDSATLSAFRRWRFKPGVASDVDVPITYTLSGVSY
jgi:protein TonB